MGVLKKFTVHGGGGQEFFLILLNFPPAHQGTYINEQSLESFCGMPYGMFLSGSFSAHTFQATVSYRKTWKNDESLATYVLYMFDY